jgi:hypothetical protein
MSVNRFWCFLAGLVLGAGLTVWALSPVLIRAQQLDGERTFQESPHPTPLVPDAGPGTQGKPEESDAAAAPPALTVQNHPGPARRHAFAVSAEPIEESPDELLASLNKAGAAFCQVKGNPFDAGAQQRYRETRKAVEQLPLEILPERPGGVDHLIINWPAQSTLSTLASLQKLQALEHVQRVTPIPKEAISK